MEPALRDELQRICRSETFRTTPRLRDFLVFLTGRTANVKGQLFKESVIGIEFFDRKAGYDAKRDPIVRVEAHRLRRRLAEYYSEEGADDPLRIELPKGSYAPVLRRRDDAPSHWRLAVLVEGSDELTAEGLAVELISKLGTLHGITVVAPRSSLETHDPDAAVRKLGANTILGCRVDGVNVRADLRRAGSPGLTPIATFDNVIQPTVEALSRFVAANLGPLPEPGRGPKRAVIDRETYQLYLSGRAWFHRWSPDNLANAAAHFERVIECCPDFAPSYAALADVQVLLAYWHVKDARDVLERGRSYAIKAIQLDADCTDAFCSLGAFEATLNRDWIAAETLFRRALDANPSNALALNWLAIIAYVPVMRFEEAVDAVFAAYDVDPASPEIGNEVVWVRICCGHFEEAAEQGRRIIALHPTFLEAYWSLGIAESALGHYAVARDVLASAEKFGPGVAFTLALRSYIEGVGGNAGAAKQYLQRLQDSASFAPLRELYLAYAYGGLGEIDRAMEHLQRAVDVADPLALYVDVFVPFAPLRHHPAFQNIRQQQRLVAAS